MYTYPPKCALPYEKHLKEFPLSFVYLSTPMTTGKRYLKTVQFDLPINKNKFLKQNMQNAKKVCKKIQAIVDLPVINPTIYQLENFESNDYLAFWVELIQLGCKTVYFVDDWEYSCGSAYEFLIAQQIGIPCLDQNGEPISLSEGYKKLSAAIEDSQLYVDTSFLKQVKNDLLKINPQTYVCTRS